MEKHQKKKLLILAGSYFQLPVIHFARKAGYYIITCDNKPGNPGHKFADEYINISTTDINGILEVAEQNKIDGILAYGTDPAAPTAAYVSQKLNLPGNSFEAVNNLSNKRLFREFLSEKGFPVAEFGVFDSLNEAENYIGKSEKTMYVKPVDSSGSKGVTRLFPGENLKFAFNYAMSFSRVGEVIIEEEIKSKGPHIHGEAFVFNGEIKFLLLGDQYFSRINPCAPLSTTLPSLEHADIMDLIYAKLKELLTLVGYKTGGLNIEIIRDEEDRLYFIEVGARNGGNLMPDLAQIVSGFDLAMANVNAVLNNPIDFKLNSTESTFCTQVILHSHSDGRLFDVNIPEKFLSKVVMQLDYYSRGDYVKLYRGSQDVIGVYLFKNRNLLECRSLIDFISNNQLINLY